MMSKNNRNSLYTGRKSWIKYAGLTVALAVICTVAFFALLKTNVFGKYEANNKAYVVEGTVKEHVDQIVTDEGNNQKGEEGTGATPCSDEVPTCVGEKGSKTNPFVVLEIVPDKSLQQLSYLGQEEGSSYPIDIMKYGIDWAKKKNKSYIDADKNTSDVPDIQRMSQNELRDSDDISEEEKLFGRWFYNDTYEVYKFGSDTDTVTKQFAYIDKLYTLEFTDEDINRVMKDDTAAGRFMSIYNDIDKKDTFADVKNYWHDMDKLSKEFPEVFEKDDKGRSIRDIALKDCHNWKTSKEIDGKLEEFDCPGYMLMVEPGEGDFGFSCYSDLYNWRFTKTGTAADRWIYVKDEAELAQKYPNHPEYVDYLKKYDQNNRAVQSTKFVYTEKNINADFNQQTDTNNMFDIVDDPELTGLVYKIEQCSKIPSLIKSVKYKFEYYGVTNNNILKRSLFTFENQKECDDFHMKVIWMTPAELNQICKKDTPSTVDMIERADMYYFQSGNFEGTDVKVNDVDQVARLYYACVAPNASKPKENISFYENDLEWSLCQKIIQRQSKVRTLPLVFNQMVGEMLKSGISRGKENETHNYLTDKAGNKPTCHQEKGSRNNIAKLYLIVSQFDLLSDDSGVSYKRTFMEHIYPYIKTISIPKENGVVDGTATTTGYYDYDGTLENNPKKLCSCNKTDNFKKRVYYLWNGYTFFPQDMDIDPLQVDVNSKQTKDKFYEQGYLPTIFESNNNSQPFQSDVTSHRNGSDGTDGKNVAFLHQPGQNSNANHTSFLGNNGDNGTLSRTMLGVIYRILNNKVQTAQPVTVKVEAQKKMYVKLTEDTVMIDYEDDGKKSPTDKDLYVKVRIKNNGNNRPGQVRKIFLNNSKGEPSKELKLYTDKACKTEYSEMWKREEGDPVEWYKGVPEEGYSVPRDNGYIVGYVKFTLNEWKKGYNELSFDTVGRSFIVQKNNPNGGELRAVKRTTPISIIGKTLFDLE